MESTLPVLVERQTLTIRQREIVLGQTTLDDILDWFAGDVTLKPCSSGCHHSVTLPTPIGPCGLRFAPDRVDLVYFSLSQPRRLEEVLAAYPNPGPGFQQIHGHTQKRHITFSVIGLDLCFNQDNLVDNIGFSRHFT